MIKENTIASVVTISSYDFIDHREFYGSTGLEEDLFWRTHSSVGKSTLLQPKWSPVPGMTDKYLMVTEWTELMLGFKWWLKEVAQNVFHTFLFLTLTFSSPQASFLQGCLALSVCQKAVFCSVSLCKHTLTWFLSFIWKCGFQMRLLPKPLEGWLDCLLTPALKFLTLNENVYYSSNKPQVMLTRLSGDHPLRTTIAHGVAIFLLPS